MTRTPTKRTSLRTLAIAMAWGVVSATATIPTLTHAQHTTNTVATQPQQTQKHMGERHKATPEERAQRTSQHLSKMKTLLQITPQQESTWQTFASSMQNLYADSDHQRMDKKALENMSTPQRLDAMRTHRMQRMEKADQRDNAIKNLYAALTPEQQKTMDSHMQKMKNRMKHHGHGADS